MISLKKTQKKSKEFSLPFQYFWIGLYMFVCVERGLKLSFLASAFHCTSLGLLMLHHCLAWQILGSGQESSPKYYGHFPENRLLGPSLKNISNSHYRSRTEKEKQHAPTVPFIWTVTLKARFYFYLSWDKAVEGQFFVIIGSWVK